MQNPPVSEQLLDQQLISLRANELAVSESQFRRPSASGVLGISEKWGPTFDATEHTMTRRMVNKTDNVDFYIIDEDKDVASVVATLLGEIDNHTAESQLLSSYLSIISSLFPSIKPIAEIFLKDKGWTINYVTLPRDADLNFLTIRTQFDTTLTLLLLAQLLFLPFKNITELGYEAFVRARMLALAGKVGFLFTDARPIMVVLSLDHALTIRAVLGACTSIRKAMVIALLNAAHASTSSDMIKQMSDYVLSILAWTEMNAFTFVIEHLVAPQSPVLQYKPIAAEVKALRIAVEAVKNFKWPQFFRVFAEPDEYRLLARDRFALLSAVAGKLRARDKKSAEKNVIPGATVEDRGKVDPAAVAFLVNLHNNTVGSSGKRRVHLEYLQYIVDEA